MGLFDTEEDYLNREHARIRNQYSGRETRQNPFRMLGGALATYRANTSPKLEQIRNTTAIMSQINPQSYDEVMMGVQMLQNVGNTEGAWKLAEYAKSIMPKEKEELLLAGPEEPWYDEKGMQLGTKQKDRYGKYQYTRHAQRAPLVNLGGKEKVKFALQEFKTANEAARGAQKTINNLDFIDQTMRGIETGSLTSWRMALGQLSSSLGLPVDDEISNLESANTAMGNLVMAALDNFPGQISNAEREFLQARMPGLTQTAEGRAAISGMLRNLSGRALAKREIMSKYVRGNNPDLTPAEGQTFYDEWAVYQKENPLFPAMDVPTGIKAKDKNGKVYQEYLDGTWRAEDGTIWGAQ